MLRKLHTVPLKASDIASVSITLTSDGTAKLNAAKANNQKVDLSGVNKQDLTQLLTTAARAL